MMSLTLKIDGYSFDFTVGGKDYCGVVITEQNCLMAEIPYRKALRKAFDCIPILEAVHEINYWATCSPDIHTIISQIHSIERYDINGHKDMRNSCLLILHQQTIELNDRDIVYAKRILSIIDHTIVVPTKTKKQKPYVKTSGYVYLIKGGKGYKIGMSKKPLERITTLGVVLPFPIKTLAIIETDDMVALEKQLHNHYTEHCLNGEWFDLRDDQVEDIKALQGEIES